MENIYKFLNYQNIDFLWGRLKNYKNYFDANNVLKELSGIHNFFEDQISYIDFHGLLARDLSYVADSERREYGDFQTPTELTDQICSLLEKNNVAPHSIIEPTFGKGSFIISALRYFKSVRYILGVEIYDRYIWESKFKILEYFLDNPQLTKPDIVLFKYDIFAFDLNKIISYITEPLLVIGNPPWITNSELSVLNSNNLPPKSNIKNHKGLDAITGKGNFDIGEYIALMMLENFDRFNGNMAFLIKNSVIRNLVHDLRKFKFRISNIKSYRIDTKKHFNASVDASLFSCNFNKTNGNIVCENFDFSNPNIELNKFGWHEDKFIADVKTYQQSRKYDGVSPFEWRQGVKHDCSKVFELSRIDNKFINGFNEEVDIEKDLVYGLIKSSDLNGTVINRPRKCVIITQHHINEDTAFIEKKCPKLYGYLCKNDQLINNRKSSIYKGKHRFSLFGIGEYSFKPYKIAVSGLYKSPSFTLLLPENDKPLMVDDTCYILGFEELSNAIFTWCILSDIKVIELLKSISFNDSKRPFTKEILMRIAIDELAKELTFDFVKEKIDNLNLIFFKLEYQDWELYLQTLNSPKYLKSQMELI
jgi:hypothetical protein